MDWPNSGGHFIRGFAAIFLFARPANLWKHFVGLYFFLRWVQHGGSWSFFVAAIAISLSLLIKITSIVILAPILYLAVAEDADLGSDPRLDGEGDRGQRPRLQLIL